MVTREEKSQGCHLVLQSEQTSEWWCHPWDQNPRWGTDSHRKFADLAWDVIILWFWPEWKHELLGESRLFTKKIKYLELRRRKVSSKENFKREGSVTGGKDREVWKGT